jgi:hypothetical protein
MKQDRFLMGILIFIGILVVAALVLFFIRQESQNYGPEDAPDGVVRNYALALQKQDYQRAYGYLADKDNKPTYDSFQRAFLTNQLNLTSNGLQVGSIQYIKNGEATVNLTLIFAGGGPFAGSSSSNDTASLVQQAGAWKLIYMPYPYWSFDWFQPTPQSIKP